MSITQPLKRRGDELSEPDYRDVPGAPGYRVGKDGSLWSCLKGDGYSHYRKMVISDTWKKLRPSPRKEDGRSRYTYRLSNGTYRRMTASVLVLEAFVGPRPDGMECCHDNGDATDDRLENIRWDTHSANLLDRRRHGTAPHGETVHTAKLTTEQVVEIRKRRDAGDGVTLLAKLYKVTAANISAICNRKTWKHV